ATAVEVDNDGKWLIPAARRSLGPVGADRNAASRPGNHTIGDLADRLARRQHPGELVGIPAPALHAQRLERFQLLEVIEQGLRQWMNGHRSSLEGVFGLESGAVV